MVLSDTQTPELRSWQINSLLLTFAFSKTVIKMNTGGFPGGAVVENLPVSAGDTGSSPGLGGSHMPRSN